MKNKYQILCESLKKSATEYRIIGFPIKTFIKDVTKTFGSSRIKHVIQSKGFQLLGYGTISIHSFFVPEFLFILNRLPRRFRYNDTIKYLEKKSWISNINKTFSSKVNFGNISKNMNVTLSDYQKDFIQIYDQKKQQYQLNGYILGFEQGLGKTLTGLALMEALEKDCIIIIAPKSTLNTVWKQHIDNFYIDDELYWIVNSNINPKNKKFYIFNYESMSKIADIKNEILKHKNIGIIVDESHNFLHLNSLRTKNLKIIQKITNCEDLLLMSGTPIKALGIEMISALMLLDKFFDDQAREIFKTAFGLNTEFAAEILNTRMGIILHRKLKSEVLKLPPKNEITIKVRIPNGNKYTIDSVQSMVTKFIIERDQYYTKEKSRFERDFEEVIRYLNQKLANDPEYNEYIKTIRYLKINKYQRKDPTIVEKVRKANLYEKEVIIPILPSNLKKKFINSKSVVKYLDLKIRGEVLGGLLPKLRAEMTSEILKNSNISKIIDNAEKKSICFTTFAEVARESIKYFQSLNYKPLLISGDTSGNIKSIINDFKTKDEYNPLIATIQTLATGVTLTEANTMFFLNKPWRHSDYSQASDRIHRRGQDTEVTIYTLLLNTGSKPNLSTRMEEVMKWSKKLFDSIVEK